MPVKTFEEYTQELDKFELSCVRPIVDFFNRSEYAGAENAIKSTNLLIRFNNKLKDTNFVQKYGIQLSKRQAPLTRPRLGKIVSYIRMQRLCFLAGTKNGYFRAVTNEEKQNEIKSMYQRVMGLFAAIDGMERMDDFKNPYDNFHKYSPTIGIFIDRHI